MNKEFEFMKKNSMGFLSTIDENGKPRVRGFGIMVTDDQQVIFGTSNKRRTFQQVKANPYVEWIGKSSSSTTLRVSGNVRIEDNEDIKMNHIKSNPVINNMYSGREHEFEMFYLEDMEFDWFEMKVAL